MSTRVLHFFTPLAFAGLLGCGDAVSNRGELVVRDSAGIHIVEVAADPVVEGGELPYRLTAEPDLSIGVIEGDEAYMFEQVSGLEVAPDGRIVVLEGRQQLVRVYSPTGVALARMGGSGGGPAELARVRGMWLSGDTIVVHDPGNRKIARYTVDGDFAGMHPLDISGNARIFAGYQPLDGDGFVITEVTGCRVPRTPDHVDNRWVRYIADADGSIIDTLDARLGTSMLSVYGDRFCSARSVPFGRDVPLVRGPDGRWALGGNGYEIRLFRIASPAERGTDAAAGWFREVTLLRRTYEPRPLTDGERRLYRDSILAGVEPDQRRAFEDALGGYPYPDAWPAYYGLLFDDAGRLWVMRTAPALPGQTGPEQSTWDVYAADGSPVHEVSMPAEVRVRSVRGEFVYGIYRDDLGVQYVRRLKLLPAT